MRLKRHREEGAFTLLELLCVIGIISVLAALLLPALSQAKAKAKRIQCVHQLRQGGLAFQSFAQDHNGQFPMAVPAGLGGSLEFSQTAYRVAGTFYFSFRHFQALSNELVTPKLVLCPADTRQPASGFGMLKNENVSYAVGINADGAHPNSILAADRNLTNDWPAAASLLRLGPNNSLRWTRDLHQFKGNLLFADGRVEEVNSPGLVATRNQLPSVADLVLPSIGQSGWPASQGLAGLPGRTGTASSGTQQTPTAAGSAVPANGSAGVPQTSALSSTATPQVASGQPGVETSLDLPVTKRGDLQTNITQGAAAAQAQAEEPGFSLFPESFTAAVVRIAKGITWLVLLLLALLMGARVLRKRASKGRGNWTRYEDPDEG